MLKESLYDVVIFAGDSTGDEIEMPPFGVQRDEAGVGHDGAEELAIGLCLGADEALVDEGWLVGDV